MAKYKFELIGVSFLYEMLDFNYDTKLIDIKNTLDQWRRRNTYRKTNSFKNLKTLVIPKINHLIPSPTQMKT